MITKWYKNLLKWMLQSGVSNGYTLVKTPGGETKYIGGGFTSSSFPNSVSKTVQINTLKGSGIHVGTGQTPATEEDYFIESKIASGLKAGSTTVRGGVDENGNPYVELSFMLSNTTGEDIVVREIGYVQGAALANTIGGSSANSNILLDRTVLSTPVTVPAGGEAVIRYTLKTVQST